MIPRRWIIVGVAALVLLAGGCVYVVKMVDDRESTSPGAPIPTPEQELTSCVDESEDEIRDCYSAALKEMVESAADPLAAVDEISAEARSDPGGYLLPNCHGLMHTVGREYAIEHDLTVASLKDALPKSNDPGCPAGYAHGIVTGVAPQIDPNDPKAAASVCDDTETRYERYSCTHGFGHAFMRITNEDLKAALGYCTKLGPNAAPDCAQGAFHDYWFSVGGYDATQKPADAETDPMKLCGDQDPEYVRQCWYRAFVDNRPSRAIESGVDVDQVCLGTEGLQRESCITAAAVIGPADPRVQFALCYGFKGADANACVRGIKLQNLLGSGNDVLVETLERCGRFGDPERLDCYAWLGKAAAVLTNGAFETEGCLALEQTDAQQACVKGAKQMNRPLVTFS